MIHSHCCLKTAEWIATHARLLEHRTATEAITYSRAVSVLDVIPQINCWDWLIILVVFVVRKQLLHALFL